MNALEQKVEKIDERVSFVESALGHFIINSSTVLNRLEKEMKDFKDEMKVFKDEMTAFKDEMKVFKDEMTEYKNWSKNMIETMNAQWGNLARKMGTLVEDIFYPSSEIVIERYFNIKPNAIAARKLIRKNGEEFEVDILATCSKTKSAFIFEIKSNPDYTEAIGIFKKKLARAHEFLDEIAGYTIYPIYGGLSMRESTVQMLTKEGIYGIIFKGNVLEIVNFNAVKRNS